MGVVGSMMACYNSALNYAKSRIQFSKPIAAYQMTQEKLVYMLTEITKSQLLNLQLGRMKDNGTLKHTHVSLAKRNNVRRHLILPVLQEKYWEQTGYLMNIL